MINDLIHMLDIPGNVEIMLSVHALAVQTHMLYLAIFQPAHLTVQFAFPTDPCLSLSDSSTTFLCFPLLYSVCTYGIQYNFAELPLILPFECSSGNYVSYSSCLNK